MLLKNVYGLISNCNKLIPNKLRPLGSVSQLSTTSPGLKSKQTSDNDKDEDDVFGYNKSSVAQARLLERMGIVKSYAKWPQYNRIIYPPTADGKPAKNPYVHHMRNMIKYPPEKLWFPAFMIRGMSIDEAIKQLSFHKLKGAGIIKEVLLEAQDLAVRQHNIEFKSNLWISFSSTSRAATIKGIRKHRGLRIGMVEYKYSNYYVRLEEGQPPANYHAEAETYEARAKAFIEKLRQRSIHLSI